MPVNTTQIVSSKYRSLYNLRNVQGSLATFDALQALHLVHGTCNYEHCAGTLSKSIDPTNLTMKSSKHDWHECVATVQSICSYRPWHPRLLIIDVIA